MFHQSVGTMFVPPLLVSHIFNERQVSGWKIVKRVFNIPFLKHLNRLMIFTKLRMDIMPLQATPPFYVHYDLQLRVLLIDKRANFSCTTCSNIQEINLKPENLCALDFKEYANFVIGTFIDCRARTGKSQQTL